MGVESGVRGAEGGRGGGAERETCSRAALWLLVGYWMQLNLVSE